MRAANGDVGAALRGDRDAHAAVRGSAAFEKYREYAQAINEDAARKATLRGLLKIGPAEPGAGAREAVPARGGGAGERDRQALLHRAR